MVGSRMGMSNTELACIEHTAIVNDATAAHCQSKSFISKEHSTLNTPHYTLKTAQSNQNLCSELNSELKSVTSLQAAAVMDLTQIAYWKCQGSLHGAYVINLT